jgi:hypothetical protein
MDSCDAFTLAPKMFAIITLYTILIIAGSLCQYNVDECKEDPCQNGGICVDAIGSYKCECPPGYEGTFVIISFTVCM